MPLQKVSHRRALRERILASFLVMRKTSTLILLICTFSATCFAKSPVGDWQAVQQDIPRGWQIIVVTSMTFPCVFEKATEQELVCTQLDRRTGADDAEIHIRRERVREVRVERREGANMSAGAAGGGAIGALGALAITGPHAGLAFVLTLLGAGMGAHGGRNTHILHGKVIYRRP